MEIDLHGYHPSDVVDTVLFDQVVQQCWEMGKGEIWFIHGHGRNRGISVGFVNTNRSDRRWLLTNVVAVLDVELSLGGPAWHKDNRIRTAGIES